MWDKYEDVKEDKTRRKTIPTRDFRLVTDNYITNKLRNIIISVLHKGIVHMKRHSSTIAVIIFMGCIWFSGNLAGNGWKIESVALILLGFILVVLGNSIQDSGYDE